MVLGGRRDPGGGEFEEGEGMHREDREDGPFRRRGQHEAAEPSRDSVIDDCGDHRQQHASDEDHDPDPQPERQGGEGERRRGDQGSDHDDPAEDLDLLEHVHAAEKVAQDDVGQERHGDEGRLGDDRQPLARHDPRGREPGDLEQVEPVATSLARDSAQAAERHDHRDRRHRGRPEEKRECRLFIASLGAVQNEHRTQQEHRPLEDQERPEEDPRLHTLAEFLDEHRRQTGRKVVAGPCRSAQ